jgi:hypothetical protein
LSAMDAVDAVLAHNLHGLEIDPRCVEIAVFALALAAWRYPDEVATLTFAIGPSATAGA